ncbi:hypothetical protein U5N25_05900 [Exiguobacterium indicum]|uniref:hypothetical protein n=1 Tax=Exiguobacterium indicum TaxID=296995 RepID=UPI00397A5CD6
MKNVFDQLNDFATQMMTEVKKAAEQGEVPAKKLVRHIRSTEADLKEIDRLLERQRTLLLELTQKQKEAKDLADKRFKQVEIANEAGEQQLAERAAIESKHYGEQYRFFEELVAETKRELNELEREALELKLKLEDLQNKRYEWMMRENVSNLKNKMNQVLDREPNATIKEEAHPFTAEEPETKQQAVDEDDIDARIAELERRIHQ